MLDPIPVLPNLEDRRCGARSLDNPLRRRLAGPSRELEGLDLRPGMTVADLGAGVGYLAPETLRRVGPQGRLYLVDPDRKSLALALRKVVGHPNVFELVDSAAHLDRIPSGSVDRVLLSLVLCCLVDKAGTMDEAWRILRPGGLALVTYPRIGVSPYRRKRSLRVTRERWSALRSRRPWVEVFSRRGWVVTRHLLRKRGTDTALSGPPT